jgi:hypothetical protein
MRFLKKKQQISISQKTLFPTFFLEKELQKQKRMGW